MFFSCWGYRCSLPHVVAQCRLSGAGLYVPCPLELFLVSYHRGAGQDECLKFSLRLFPHELKTSVIFLPSPRDNEVWKVVTWCQLGFVWGSPHLLQIPLPSQCWFVVVLLGKKIPLTCSRQNQLPHLTARGFCSCQHLTEFMLMGARVCTPWCSTAHLIASTLYQIWFRGI